MAPGGLSGQSLISMSSAELGRPAPLTLPVNAVLREAPLLLLLLRLALLLVQGGQRGVVVPRDMGGQARVAGGSRETIELFL